MGCRHTWEAVGGGERARIMRWMSTSSLGLGGTLVEREGGRPEGLADRCIGDLGAPPGAGGSR